MAREPSSGSRPSPPNGSRHAGTAAGCAAARRQIPSPVHRRTYPARLPLRAAASSTPTAWSANRCARFDSIRFDSIRFDPVRFERAHDFVLVLSSVLDLLDVSCRTTDPLVRRPLLSADASLLLRVIRHACTRRPRQRSRRRRPLLLSPLHRVPSRHCRAHYMPPSARRCTTTSW